MLYTKLLEQLDTFGPFHPDTVLCDYERALQNAVLSAWPSTTIRGCYFHFKQCLWRRFAQSDLVPEYQVLGSQIRKSFQMIGALPFLPLDDMNRAWRLLKPTLPSDMDTFTKYVEDTWIGTSTTDPMFD